MHLSPWRVGLLVVIFIVSHLAFGDQKIKTKSNIKNDRVAESSSAGACSDAKKTSTDEKSSCDSAGQSSAAAESSKSQPKAQ